MEGSENTNVLMWLFLIILYIIFYFIVDFEIINISLLAHFSPVFHFYTPWNVRENGTLG